MKEIGTYMALNVNPLDILKIRKVFTDAMIKDLIPDMHITLMYAPEQNEVHRIEARPDRKYTCEVTGLDVMGTGKWKALVFKLKCPALVRRHWAISKSFGLKHSYHPEFNLHTSVKYQPTDSDIKTFLNMKALVGMKIEVSGEHVKPLNP